MLDFLIEFVCEFLFEGTVELSQNKKVPKWLRCIFGSLIILLYIAVIATIFIIGISILKTTILGEILLIILGFVLLIASIIKFKSAYKKF